MQQVTHQGFFKLVDAPKASRSGSLLVPQCNLCGLYKRCRTKKMPHSGKGARKILVLGEAPGLQEDYQGKAFVGPSGQLLESMLHEVDIDLRRDCWVTNACICHPLHNKLPPKAVDYCRPNVIKTIQELNPEIIVPLGASAVRSLLAWQWKDDVGSIGRWVGWQIPCQRLNCWITPTWHPAHLLRGGAGKGEVSASDEISEKSSGVMQLLFHKHLKAMAKLKGRPWNPVPDYRKLLVTTLNQEQTVNQIHNFMRRKKPLAFDYETNTLKPDAKYSEIFCCSISDGEVSIAFPWHGRKVIETMKEFLQSDVPKIGQNAKFETRHTLARFGFQVNNWLFDTMLGMHVIDNRPNITGLEFQSFVWLGYVAGKEKWSEYLRSDGSNSINRIKEAPLEGMLQYCALDSLLEWKIAEKQMKQLGIPMS